VPSDNTHVLAGEETERGTRWTEREDGSATSA